MVSDRAYRKAMSHDDAVKELRRCGGTQFHPAVVKAFCAAWSERRVEMPAAN